MSADVRFLLLLAAVMGLVAAYGGGWLIRYHWRLWRARRAWRQLSRTLVRARQRQRDQRDTRALYGDSLIDALKGLLK